MYRWFNRHYFRITVVMEIIIITLITVLGLYVSGDIYRHHMDAANYPILEKGYVQELPEGNLEVELPRELDVVDGKVILHLEIRPALAERGGLGFRVEDTFVRVLLNDELIYSNHPENGRPVELGREWVHFDLHRYRGGVGNLTIELTPITKEPLLTVEPLYIGNQQEIFTMAMLRDIQRYILVLVLLIMGCFVLFFRYVYTKTIGLGRSAGMLGVGAICAAMAVFSSTNMVSFDFMPGHILKVFLYTSIILCSMSIAGYIVQIETITSKRAILWMIGIGIAWAILFFANNLMYPKLFLFSEKIMTFAISMGTMFFCFIQVVRDYRRGNEQLLTLVLSMFLMLLPMLMDVVPRFTIAKDNIAPLLFGIFIFFATNIVCEIRRTSSMHEWASLMSYYKMLARMDYMTGLRNRVSLAEDLESYAKKKNEQKMIFMDVDNLKGVNDNYGHHMGDDMIKTTADLIKVCFLELGCCYRMSGDEFLCVSDVPSEAIEKAIRCFREEVQKLNTEKPYHYRVSVGMAGYDAQKDRSLEDTMSRAENEMYADKQRERRSNPS